MTMAPLMLMLALVRTRKCRFSELGSLFPLVPGAPAVADNLRWNPVNVRWDPVNVRSNSVNARWNPFRFPAVARKSHGG